MCFDPSFNRAVLSIDVKRLTFSCPQPTMSTQKATTMCLSTTRLDSIKRELCADLERGLVRINKTLAAISTHVPDDWHIHFDVQQCRITIEGEGTNQANMDLLLKLAHVFNRKPDIHFIADGWDGTLMTPMPELVNIWVTNVSNPDGPRPKLT